MSGARKDVNERRQLALEIVRRLCAAGERVTQKRVADMVAEALGQDDETARRTCEDDLRALVEAGLVTRERQGARMRYVVDGHASAWVHAPAAGRRWARGRRERVATERSCLCCGRKFRSQGPHHRMCDRCREGDGLPHVVYV